VSVVVIHFWGEGRVGISTRIISEKDIWQCHPYGVYAEPPAKSERGV